MEMKGITGFYEEEPEKAIREAVEQIGRRAYAKELGTRGFEDILKIVVVSDGEKVWVRKTGFFHCCGGLDGGHWAGSGT